MTGNQQAPSSTRQPLPAWVKVLLTVLALAVTAVLVTLLIRSVSYAGVDAPTSDEFQQHFEQNS